MAPPTRRSIPQEERLIVALDVPSFDEAQSLVEQLGEPVHVVEGDVRNVKVTTQADLALVRALLGLRAPSERPAHKRF